MNLPGDVIWFPFNVTNSWNLTTSAVCVISVLSAAPPVYYGLATSTPSFSTLGGEEFTIVGANFHTFDNGLNRVNVTYGPYMAQVCGTCALAPAVCQR